MASAAWDGTVRLWNVSACIEAMTCKASQILAWNSWLTSVTFSPDGRLLASSSWDLNNPQNSSIQIWDRASRKTNSKPIKVLQGHTNNVKSISFSRDGKLLASGSADQTLKLWDMDTLTEIKTFRGHTDEVNGVSFSPDGKLLASASDDQTLKLWDIATGQEIRTLRGHTAPVIGVSFSRDGQRLVSASADKTIKLWDVTTGNEITTLKGHQQSIRNLSLSDDGQLLASGSDSSTGEGELFLWDVKALSNLTLADLMKEGCNWADDYLQNNPNVSESDRHLCDK